MGSSSSLFIPALNHYNSDGLFIIIRAKPRSVLSTSVQDMRLLCFVLINSRAGFKRPASGRKEGGDVLMLLQGAGSFLALLIPKIPKEK